MVKFWLERFVDEIDEENKEIYTINGGMAVSGPIHIGKLRGEVIYPSVIYRILKNRGKEAKHYVTIYTQDPLKAKEPLVTKKFIEEWKGVRILNVPDPFGDHSNWVEHFYEPYEKCYEEYGITAKPVFTHELYEKDERMHEAINILIKNRDKAREILNKYKGEKLKENWVPFKPLCKKCFNILTTKATKIEEEKVHYYCEKCGNEGVTSIYEGKLEWRAEWVALWYALKVDVELYGKDHAAAGGSRDSCNELYSKIFGMKPPKGFGYEWVDLVVNNKREPMGSSEGVSFDVDEWLRVGRPEVLKYWYLIMKAKTHLDFDPSSTIPLLHEEYDKAERVYFNIEKPFNEELLHDIKFSYLASNDFNPPKEIPLQVPYSYLAIIAQILPHTNKVEEAIKKLRRTGHITKENLNEGDYVFLEKMISKVSYWVKKYAPSRLIIKLNKEPPVQLKSSLNEQHIEFLKEISNILNDWDESQASILENKIYQTIKSKGLTSQEGFRILYQIILGQNSGPKLVSLIQAVGKMEVLKLINGILSF
jgi:lysyl-tRNA synthetase, archaeal and spirochete